MRRVKAIIAAFLALVVIASTTPVLAKVVDIRSPTTTVQQEEAAKKRFFAADVSAVMLRSFIRDMNSTEVAYFFFDPDRSVVEVGDDGNVYVVLAGTQRYLTKMLGEKETRELIAGTWYFMNALHATIAPESELYVALVYDAKITYATDGKTVFDDSLNMYPFELPDRFRETY